MSANDRGHVIRQRVVYVGRVQGVGFRMTTVELARRHAGVAGYVRNRPEGTVELEAEGPPDAVNALLADVSEHFSGHIQDSHKTSVEPQGEKGFDIRY